MACANSAQQKQVLEVAFWETDPLERPDSDSVENIVNKMGDARVFLEKLREFKEDFAHARDILELGAGQGWTSVIVKRMHPQARVVATDVAAAAVRSVYKWEHIFRTTIETRACPSNKVPFPDGSFDLIFTFAAAHHFHQHRSTLAEISRLLRPGGAAFYLHEPGCRRYIYSLAHRRVDAKRPNVEDVLVYRHIVRMASDFGLTCDCLLDPTLTDRRPLQTVYYFILSRLRFLGDILPCTVNLVFRKT
jgi:SAM-dependent methyltransferase